MHRTIGRQHPSTANRAVVLLSHFFGWAVDRGRAARGSENPARGVKKFKEQGRERYLTSKELRRLGEALREAETSGIEWRPDETKATAKHAPKRRDSRLVKLGVHAAAALRLLLLTGARLREILHLEWSHVDMERGMLFLPDSKTGRKMIVLGLPAIDVLADLAKERDARPTGSRFVICGDDPERPRADLKRPWRLISKHANLEGVRLHDLRHSFASFGAGFGMGLPIIGRLLGHVDPATTARYAHLDADPVRRASNLVSGAILEALNGETN
jgi:integrase